MPISNPIIEASHNESPFLTNDLEDSQDKEFYQLQKEKIKEESEDNEHSEKIEEENDDKQRNLSDDEDNIIPLEERVDIIKEDLLEQNSI